MNLRNFSDKRSASLLTLCVVAMLLSLSSGYAMAQGLAISSGGTPSYDVPIGVPPGVGGMTPSLGLHYSGSGINGPVGFGWNVQGVSIISRCSGDKRIDGKAQAVAYNGNDKLCLDGQRLIQTDAGGNPLASQQGDSLGGTGAVREYRTDKDIYSRIRAYGFNGDAANGPAYFKVWTKSGQVYEYGNGGNAAITVTGKNIVSAWAVNRISDTVGNYIDFRYLQRDVAWGTGPTAGVPVSGHEWQLKEVLYTGTVTQQPVNRVVFNYSDRPAAAPGSAQDRVETYHQGGKNVSIWLLDSISTFINWPADQATRPSTAINVKTTSLTYDRGPLTNRSRVQKITECVGDAGNKCLPPTTFTYSPGDALNYSANEAFKTGPLATTILHSLAGDYGVLQADFNGDGKLDILRWSDRPAENQLYLSGASAGQYSLANNFNIRDQNLFKSDGCYTTLLTDINGDGLPDMLRYSASTNLNGSTCASYGPIYTYLNNGDGSFSRRDFPSNISMARRASAARPACFKTNSCDDPINHPGWTAGANFYLIDVDGDGRLDIITTILPSYATNAEEIDPCGAIECTKIYRSQGDGTFTQIATNLANVSVYMPPSAAGGVGASQRFKDVNRDGLTDLLRLPTKYFNWWPSFLSRGDGNFDGIAAPVLGDTCELNLDVNGDGLPDCLIPGDSPASNKLLISNGASGSSATANFNLTGTGHEMTAASLAGIQVADLDGDGREDILRWRDNPALNTVYLSNGDGQFRTASFNLTGANNQLRKSDGTATFILGDFIGAGNAQILRLKASPTAGDGTANQLYVKSNGMPPDQLMSVRTGNGITTDLKWVQLTDSVSGTLGQRYKSDRGTPNAAVYPTVDVMPAAYVVATTVADSGFGGTLQVNEYAYAGMKWSSDGRGWLGFRNNLSQSTAPSGELLTVSTYNIQNGPNPGPASVTETRLGALNQPNSPLLSRSTFIYCDMTAAAGAQASATSNSPCATNAKVQRPYLYQSIEEGWDLQGTGLPKVTTTNVFNNDGDATDILVVTSSTTGQAQSSIKRTTNEYHAAAIDGDNWILGRLKKATVFNDVSNSSLNLPTSAGSAPLATANVGTGAEPSVTPLVPSVNPAVLNQIIMLLLGDD